MKYLTRPSLFTFVLEYDGYTSVSQFRGSSVDAALAAWGRAMAAAKSRHLHKHTARISQGLAADRPVKLDGVQNVWCLSTSVDYKLALLNIVRTS